MHPVARHLVRVPHRVRPAGLGPRWRRHHLDAGAALRRRHRGQGGLRRHDPQGREAPHGSRRPRPRGHAPRVGVVVVGQGLGRGPAAAVGVGPRLGAGSAAGQAPPVSGALAHDARPGTGTGTTAAPEPGSARNPVPVDYAVLGAGCAGLATAIALAERRSAGSVVLLDARTAYTDDHTWSFWHVEPTPFDDCITARWSSWAVRAGGRTVTTTAAATPYVSIRASDYYREALHRLAGLADVRLRLGTAVTGVDAGPDGSTVRTPSGDVPARRVVDARGPVDTRPEDGGGAFAQRFLGVRVRAHRPVFDPGVVTLMDFDVDQSRGIHFVYVLPASRTEALVEDTYLTEAAVPRAVLEAGITTYLRERHGLGPDELDRMGGEHGVIPMRLAGRDVPPDIVGVRGGAVRPSTGYAFLRIQRAAAGLAAGHRTPPRGPMRTWVLDTVFLRFLQDRPDAVPGVFLRMFDRVPGDALVRFLTERSTARDDLRMVLALPTVPFLLAAVRVVVRALLATARDRRAGRLADRSAPG
ncbi:hypothetical protein DEI86_04795 [Curtobacterium sp. MCBD17_028]|nr:hypothetical protein DEI86_04795 [Curtobacterium sp. MCBD17_028]